MTEKVWAELVSQGGAVDNSGKEEVLWPSETNKEANKAFWIITFFIKIKKLAKNTILSFALHSLT